MFSIFKTIPEPEKEREFKKWQKLENGIDRIHHEVKRKILGYNSADTFGFFNLQSRYFNWRTQIYPKMPEGQKPKELLAMIWAVEGLLPAALHHTRGNPTSEETAFGERSKTLWAAFQKQNTENINMQYEGACKIFFSYVADPPSREIIVDPFNFAPIRFTIELNYLFHTNRVRCPSLEDARQFDRAFLILFQHRNGPELSFADHPYSSVLNGTLDASIPLPGVEVEVNYQPSRLEVKPPHPSATTKEPISLKMTGQEARLVMKYGRTEIIHEDELTRRYWTYKKNPLYADLQDELKTAYQILLKIAV
jgi:hypothetical protein